jgi:hypothetical protein
MAQSRALPSARLLAEAIQHIMATSMQNPAAAIDADELVCRLMTHCLADPDAPPTMSDGQIDVALELLGKALPDLVEVLVSESEGRRVSVRVTPE